MSTWTQHHRVDDVELVVGGDVWLITGRLDITMVRDRNADGDADGNRGRDVTYEDERIWKLESVQCEGDDWVGTVMAGADIPENVVAAAAEWAETYQPDWDDSDGDLDDEREED
jgi:hypothetical protein